MKPTRHIYTPEEKAHALDLYVRVGPCQAARETGIKKPTIRSWAKKAGLRPPTEHIGEAARATEARIAAKRAALKERLIDEAHHCLDAIHREHVDFKGGGNLGPQKVVYPVAPAAAVQQYATSMAIFLDKFRLENGEVTGREEVVTVDAVDAAIRELETELARRGSLERGAPS